MKVRLVAPGLAGLVIAAGLFAAARLNAPAELAGSVQAGGKPIGGATVTLFAAGTAVPTKLAESRTDDQGAFKLDITHAPKDSVLYVIAKAARRRRQRTKAPTTLSWCWLCWGMKRRNM